MVPKRRPFDEDWSPRLPKRRPFAEDQSLRLPKRRSFDEDWSPRLPKRRRFDLTLGEFEARRGARSGICQVPDWIVGSWQVPLLGGRA